MNNINNSIVHSSVHLNTLLTITVSNNTTNSNNLAEYKCLSSALGYYLSTNSTNPKMGVN